MNESPISLRQPAAFRSVMADSSTPVASEHMQQELVHLGQLAECAWKGTRAVTAYYVGEGSFHELGDAAVLVHATTFEPVIARHAPGTVRNLQRIADLDAAVASPGVAPLLDALTEFAGQARAVLTALQIAQQAHTALDAALLQLSRHMPPADALSRTLAADNLAEALTALGIEL